MKSEVNAFLRAFFAGMQGMKIELSDEEIKAVNNFARSNHVVPIAYLGVKKPEMESQSFFSFRKEMLAFCSKQTIMNEILSRFLKMLSENEVAYCVLKGPAVAAYYPDFNMRTSSDFDILIDPKQSDKMIEVVKAFGGSIIEEWTNEDCIHANLDGFLHLEIHTTLFEEKNISYANDFSFEKVFKRENLETVQVDELEFVTLKPQIHLLYLICHCAVHFINAGCGVRQLADCWTYASKNIQRIDFDKLFEKLEEYSLKKFAQIVFFIGIKHCGADERIIPDSVEDLTAISDEMLEDCVDGGVFGRANAERAATTTVTNEKKMSFAHALFPPAEYLKKRYPNSVLPIAWCRRIVDFLKKSGGGNPLKHINKTVEIARGRMDLINRLGIYGNTDLPKKVINTDNAEKEIEELVKNGSVKIRILGDSMAPFLKNGRDYAILEAFSGELVKGEIYFYRRESGNLVLHRLIKKKNDELIMCGDSQLIIERGITAKNIFAVATSFEIDGKTVKKSSLKYLFYSKIWSCMPLRKVAFRILQYGKRKKT